MAKFFAQENERAETKAPEAEQHRLNAAEYAIRLDEIDCLIKGVGCKQESQNVIPMYRSPGSAFPTKQSLRYRNPGATTDIVALVYDSPGIDIDAVMTTVFDKYRQQGTTRDTISKMIRRMIRQGYACRDGTKLFLTEICKNAREASPLYRAS